MREAWSFIVLCATIAALFFCIVQAFAGLFAVTSAGKIEGLCWAILAGVILVLHEVRKWRPL